MGKGKYFLSGLLICMVGIFANSAHAKPTEAVMHNFGNGCSQDECTDGSSPNLGALTLVGTTLYGMTPNGSSVLTDNVSTGTIFQIHVDGSGYKVIHNFGLKAGDGSIPENSTLTLSGTTLYGMTLRGGSNGVGTIFKINTDGSGYQVIYNFGNSTSDASSPSGSLTIVGSTLYGMTPWGGSNGEGAIFKINTDGTGYRIIYDFPYSNAGNNIDPTGSFTLMGGALYGMTSNGGSNANGTIFKINTDGTGYQVIYNFSRFGSVSGQVPIGALTVSGSTFYGVTASGGANSNGTIFRINTDGSGYQDIYSFESNSSDQSVRQPTGSLILSGSTLYGILTLGGSLASFGVNPGGVIFQIGTDGNGFQILHNFAGAPHDGAQPYGSLILSGSTFYGMTNWGGSNNYGTIFSLSGAVTPPPATVPGAPTGVKATSGNAQAEVTFTPPASNGGSPITRYNVTPYIGTSAGKTISGPSSPIIVTGLTNGTPYTFTVTATNKIGASLPSNSSAPVTPATVPSAPTIGTVTAGNAEVTVNFIASKSDGGSPITGYTVVSSPKGGVDKNAGTTSTAPRIVTGLKNGTPYTFIVTVKNAKGSNSSKPSKAVTPRK